MAEMRESHGECVRHESPNIQCADMKIPIQGQVPTFEHGRYSDVVREVYMDLITTMGVSSTKASEVVKVVLQKLGRSKIGRLPSQSFCKYMVLEARQVSLQHLQSTLLSENNLTLCTDATSKFGHKYGTAGIFLKDGTRLHLGVREQASGSAQCTFDTVREMIHDVVSSGGEEVSDFCEKDIFSKIKNLMSDRASTEKRFNEILAQYRASILPDIVEDFDQCSEVEKARLCGE